MKQLKIKYTHLYILYIIKECFIFVLLCLFVSNFVDFCIIVEYNFIKKLPSSILQLHQLPIPTKLPYAECVYNIK